MVVENSKRWVAIAALLLIGGAAAAIWLAPYRLSESEGSSVARLRAATERLLERSMAARDARRKNVQPAPVSAVYQLDERLAEARVEPPSGPGSVSEVDGPIDISLTSTDLDRPFVFGRTFEVAAGDSYLRSEPDLALDRDSVGFLEIRMRSRQGRMATVRWSREAGADWYDRELGSLLVPLAADDRFHIYRVGADQILGRRLATGDQLRTLLFRPSDVLGDSVEIDYVRMGAARHRFTRGFGVASETIAGQLRRVLYLWTPRRLSYRVSVPPEAPALSFAVGVLRPEIPVRFSVTVSSDDGPSREVFSRTVRSRGAWIDAEVRLDGWAGQDVEIGLRAESASANLAFYASPAITSRTRAPSVLLVVEDTLRADRLSLYGHERPTSPTKDRLAATGVVFDRAISQATKTRPSVASYMTSLYPTATGVVGFEHAIDDAQTTLAEVLRANGYATAAFVQNDNAGTSAGLNQGFDVYEGPETSKTQPDGVYGERTIGWIDSLAGRRFFAYLHVLDPHGPYDPPSPFDRWHEGAPAGDRTLEWSKDFDPARLRYPTATGRRRRYDGEVAHNDEALGKFLASLEKRGLLDNTLVVFMSDHGEFLGERDRWGHRPPGYVQATHVPLLLRLPDRVPGGVRVGEPVQLLDVMPTILDILGVPWTGLGLQGESLVPLFEAGGRREVELAYSEEPSAYEGRPDAVSGSLFVGQRHVLRSLVLGSSLVFDLDSDPREQTPLARGGAIAQLEAIVGPFERQMRRINLQILEAVRRNSAGDEKVAIEPEAIERLRALGYVGGPR